ncbi:hypothetical protein FACS189432_02630 [Bacteroidia bacterium]|nr:hypothetical protein FACS189426_00690 [Bacteroidia bacterium]GHT27018.1 hypothetical protein FACS189432_02630 [Bacteroidia bacterium]
MKSVYICIVSFFIASFAYSQNSTFSPEWAFGFNGGSTFSKISFTSSIRVPQQLLPQYSGGLTVRYISEHHFGIQGELNYSQRGWKEVTDSIHFDKLTRSLAYLELPLMTHIYFGLGKRVNFVFNIGPQVSWFLNEKVVDKELNTPNEAPIYYDMKVQHKFDYGIKGALGLEFKTGIGSFILDGRYYFGLSDIYNNTRSDLFQASSNKVLGVNLTYLFRIKK